MLAFEEWCDSLSNLERLIAPYILAVQAVDDMEQYLVQPSKVVRVAMLPELRETHMVAAKNEMLVGLLPSTDGGDNGSISISVGISSFT